VHSCILLEQFNFYLHNIESITSIITLNCSCLLLWWLVKICLCIFFWPCCFQVQLDWSKVIKLLVMSSLTSSWSQACNTDWFLKFFASLSHSPLDVNYYHLQIVFDLSQNHHLTSLAEMCVVVMLDVVLHAYLLPT
jgi:hypothetical protein